MLAHDQLAPFADLAGSHFFARALFLASAKATWTVSLEDALRVACSD